MTPDDETLMAYVDDELDASARAAIESAMREDAGVAERVAEHRALRGLISGAFREVLDEPVPDRLTAAVRGIEPDSGASVVSIDSARKTRSEATVTRKHTARSWVALAACVTGGIAIGLALGIERRAISNLAFASDGAVLAHGELAQVLEKKPASGTAGPIQVGLTFASNDGRYCRTFSVAGAPQRAGIACRSGGVWRVDALEEFTLPHEAGDYRTARSSLSPTLRAGVEARMSGEAFDAAQEAAVLRDGWSRRSSSDRDE